MDADVAEEVVDSAADSATEEVASPAADSDSISPAASTTSPSGGGAGTLNDGHKFAAARFVMVHSNVDRAQMTASLAKFNDPRNADGSEFMILVGSKVMKESHDVKAIQNVFIMGRPDNIPTLLQIRGRAVRKNSHRDLPPDKRVVNILIFTSCLPRAVTIATGGSVRSELASQRVNTANFEELESAITSHFTGAASANPASSTSPCHMSHEEIKYQEKVLQFRIMQQIERTLHENAIDAVVNRKLIERISPIPDPLDVLAFTPTSRRQKKQTSETFDVYYRSREVEQLRYLIKRFFIEYSSVWSHTDLLAIIRKDPQHWCNMDSSRFTEANYLIALDQLTWKDETAHVEPLHVGSQSMVDRLFDPNDKIITLPNGGKNIIIPAAETSGAKQYYILFPVHNGAPEIDVELPYRTANQSATRAINMNVFARTKRVDFDYPDKRRIFRVKYMHTSIDNMENVICEYGSIFHVKFLEECVRYVFGVWTNPEQEIDEDWHEFYFKLLYYYDLLSLVMWAYTCKPRVFAQYTKYALPVQSKDIKLLALAEYDARNTVESETNTSHGIINLLKRSINRTSNAWIPREFREGYERTLAKSYTQFRGRKKKPKLGKISARVLPVGHFIGKFPRIYHPERGWVEDPTYKQLDGSYTENDIIVGFDEQSPTGVHTRFKLRKPVQRIKRHSDNRLIERGTVCKSKSKADLRKIADQIGAIIPDKINVEGLCGIIRSKLIRLELKERIKGSKIKWFYFFYEEQG